MILKIGEVSQKSGLSVKTIRYYADLGLLTPSLTKNKSGYRLFDKSVFRRLEFIRCSQSLGLSLKEIEVILGVRDGGNIPCGVAKQVLLDKLDTIKEQINELNILQLELEELLTEWEDSPSPESLNNTICPNIQKLP
jgi:DNA-binding transcriptional MerR regulator